MMASTDDDQVVDEHTVFWLFFEVADTQYVRQGHQYWARHGERFRIKVEVDEATYRAAHAEQTQEAGADFTMPLDYHWWQDVPVPSENAHRHDYSVRVTRGGYIDWWGR